MALGLTPVASWPVAAAFNRTILIEAGAYTHTGVAIGMIRAISVNVLARVSLTGTTAAPTRFPMSLIQNFEMTAGDTKTLVVTVKDANDTAVSISGATIKWQCARSYGKTSNISKSTSSGIAITDGPNGQFTVTLNASDTESLSGNFIHEAEVTLAGTITTVLSGTMTVRKALIEAT